MALSASLKKRLAAASKKFKTTKPAASSGMVNENVEDGNYTGQLVGAEVVEQAAKAAVVLAYDLQMEGGETEQVKSRYWLETDQNLAYLKRDLARFGYDDLDSIDLAEDLAGLLEELVSLKAVCRLSVKNDGQWQNVYLNKVVEIAESPEDAENDDEEGSSVSAGDTVTYKKKEYTVIAVDSDDETCILKGADKKKVVDVPLDAVVKQEDEEEEEEEEPEEEELAELTAGSKVTVNWKGKEEPGVVKSVDEDAEKVTVRLTSTKKLVTVGIDKIELTE